MWDLKLIFLDFFFWSTLLLLDFFVKLFNILDPLFQSGFSLLNFKDLYEFPQNMSFFFAVKFCICIGFLILIRGGTPRYRYDYLTKLGWLKFLSLIILIFSSSLLFIFLF